MRGMSEAQSVFTKIVAGEIPSWKLYEDGLVYAFLDIGPLSRGHCLVIPKRCYETLDQVPDETAAAIGRVLPRLARAVLAATGATAYNVLQNNGKAAHQEVPHVHFHIIPKYAPGSANGSGLSIGWPAGKLDPAEGEALRDAIVAAL